jgi:hypothetical protein
MHSIRVTIIKMMLNSCVVLLALTPVASSAAQQRTAAQGSSEVKDAQTNQGDQDAGTEEQTPAPNIKQRFAKTGPGFVNLITGGENPSPANRGSPHVPLDSWVYPVFDRLVSLALVDTAFSGMRPWTRTYCAQMISEAREQIDRDPAQWNDTVRDLVDELAKEFEPELEADKPDAPGNTSFRMESLYSRTEHISGMPLTDGYDFGEITASPPTPRMAGGSHTCEGRDKPRRVSRPCPFQLVNFSRKRITACLCRLPRHNPQ